MEEQNKKTYLGEGQIFQDFFSEYLSFTSSDIILHMVSSTSLHDHTRPYTLEKSYNKLAFLSDLVEK